MSEIEFHVPGTPVPQGSTRAFIAGGRARTTNDPTGRLGRWRTDIRAGFLAAAPGWRVVPAGEPVDMTLIFYFARPSAHMLPANSRRSAPVLRPDAPTAHTQQPDLDKLARAILDGLTGVAYVDDQQVAFLAMRKEWAERSGVSVMLQTREPARLSLAL